MTHLLSNGQRLALVTGPALIVAVPEAWPVEAMADDYRNARNVWREVPETFYWEMLEVLPPIYQRGGFLVSEPYMHETTAEGDQGVYAGIAQGGDRYFARYCTVPEFSGRVAELRAALAGG